MNLEELKALRESLSHRERSEFMRGRGYRDWLDDRIATLEYHQSNPPAVGDQVIVYNSYGTMVEIEEARISAITKQGRLVVDHRHDATWAGKSFYKSGQNCRAPKGQLWLIPKAVFDRGQ